MQKVVLTFGLIAGAILSVMMLITMVLLRDKIGFDNGEVIGYTTMVLAFLMIFFGVKSYRDNVAGGTISFGRAFQVGILIMAIGSACYVATWEVIYFKFEPDFGDKYAAYAVGQARKAGKSEEEVQALQKKMDEFTKEYKNPLVNIAFTFLEPLPVGLLVTLVSAGVLKKKKPVMA